MGTYTFVNLKDYVKLSLGNRTGLSTYLPLWVNGAYTELCSTNKVVTRRGMKNITFPTLDTDADSATIDGQSYVSRPSNCLHIHTVWDITNDKRLTYRSPRWYFDQTGRADTSSEGTPDFWVPYGNKTYLYSTPDDAYNIRTYFRKRPTRLVGDGETTEIGEEWDEAILALATVKGHMWLRDFGNAEIWRNEYFSILQRLVGMQDKEVKDLDTHFSIDQGYDQFGY